MFSTFYIWGHVVSVGISSFSFVVLLEISHEAIAHLENFSLLFLMLLQSYFNLFSFVFVGFNSCFFIIHLRLWDSHFLEKILVLFLWFFWKSLKQTWIVYHRHCDHSHFLIFQWVLYAELLLDQHLIYFVCSNQLLSIYYNDFKCNHNPTNIL